MRTFVMGDIHGNFKALCQCLDMVEFEYKKDLLIQLGDIADGYNEVYQCVELLLRIDNLIAIRGNHDAWFSDFIQTGLHPDKWSQGGRATAYSYLKIIGKEHLIQPVNAGYETALNPGDIPESHQEFFKHQVLYYVDGKNNCYVHGGFDRHLEFKGQAPVTYYWDRDLWLSALSYQAFNRHQQFNDEFHMVTKFNEIFIGHTNTLNWRTDKPMKAANIYNIDTGAGHGHKLTVMDVDSKRYWQSEPARHLYEAFS